MTKEDIISTVESSRIRETDKQVLLDIIRNEDTVISLEALRQFVNAMQSMAKSYIDKAGIVLEVKGDFEGELEKIDLAFQKEVDEAEKELSTLDIARRDLDIAYKKGRK